MKYSLCLFTFNEIKGCEYDVPNIETYHFDEVFAIDGGSTDGTIEYLEKQNIPVYIQKKRGYNSAYIEAFEKCSTDVLIVFHPKGSISPDTLLTFKTYFDNGNDLVIASRIIKGSQNEEDRKILKPRKWFVQILSFVVSFLWRKNGYRVRDVLHGYRGMRVNSFKSIKPLDYGLSMDVEMVVRSYKLGYKCVEFPIIENVRMDGSSHFKAWPTGKNIISYLWFELNRKD